MFCVHIVYHIYYICYVISTCMSNVNLTKLSIKHLFNLIKTEIILSLLFALSLVYFLKESTLLAPSLQEC